MSDDSVHAALRSDAPLVVVEAPAGCGKTTKGADYAREIAVADTTNRLLILTHTHAACSVFADRTRGVGSRVEIRTIDSVIAHIASALLYATRSLAILLLLFLWSGAGD